jgi:hypothetical protein
MRLVQTTQDQWLHDAERGKPLTQAERAAPAKEIKNKSQIAPRALKALETLIVLAETEQLQTLAAQELTRADAERFRCSQSRFRSVCWARKKPYLRSIILPTT